MRSHVWFGVVLALAAIAVACGGGEASDPTPTVVPTAIQTADDGILRLPTGDFTPEELSNIELIYISAFYSEVICGDYLGHTDEEVLQARIRGYESDDQSTFVRPLAEVDAADILTAAQIRREECERFAP